VSIVYLSEEKEPILAGVNKILKTGQVVFKAGEPADGMYIVRKGELIVFLEQDGKEVVLAKISEGGMIGEMALFDRQPRSASVKASKDSEVTLISLDDFTKLMKQIPNWFVGIMSGLSGRLRTTNERLKQIESTNPSNFSIPTVGKPFQQLLRLVNIAELLWHRDGSKEGKDWCVSRKIVEETLTVKFGEDPEKVNAFLDFLEKEQIVSRRLDQHKTPVLVLSNRGALRQFTDFIGQFMQSNPGISSIPNETLNIYKVLHRLGGKASYEQFTVTAEDVAEEAKFIGVDPADWGVFMQNFVTFGDTVKIVKSTSKSGIALKIVKNELPALLKNIHMINRIKSSKLD
jgi:CRP-like cAMP-binding protein